MYLLLKNFNSYLENILKKEVLNSYLVLFILVKKRFAILVLVIFLISFLSFSVYSKGEDDDSSFVEITGSGDGDLNFDGINNVIDVVFLANGILYNDLMDNQEIEADINEDGIINLVDLILLVNLILD